MVIMVRLLFTLMMRERLIYLVVGALFISCSMPLIFDTPLYGKVFMEQELRSFVSTFEMRNSLDDEAGSDSKEDRKRDQEMAQLARRALSSEDDRTFFNYAERYYSNQMDAIASGSIVGGEEATRADLALCRGLLESNSTRAISTSRELTGISYLPYAIGQIPSPLLFLPSIISSFITMEGMRRGTLAHASPIPIIKKYGAAAACACLSTTIMLLLAFMPPLFISTALNGIGDASYPVVLVRSGMIVVSTAGQALESFALLILPASALCTIISISFSMLLRIWQAGPLASLVLVLLPLFPGALDANGPVAFLIGPIPLETLDPIRLTGYVGCFPLSLPETITTVSRSIAGSFIYAIAITLGTLIVLRLRESSRTIKCADGTNSLIIHDAAIGYPHRTVATIPDFIFNRHAIYGLAAPNGTGKTTLLKAISGEDPRVLRRGTISIDGISSRDEKDYRQRIFFLPANQSKLHTRLSSREHLEFIARAWGSMKSVEAIAARFKVQNYIDIPVHKLSSGMKQQLMLAMAEASDADYMVLDEPMNSLDPQMSDIDKCLIAAWANEGKGVIISSHLLDGLSELTDTVLFLKGGKLALRRFDGADSLKTEYFNEYRQDEEK